MEDRLFIFTSDITMKRGLLRFCCSVLVVVLLVFVIDCTVGVVMDYMLPRTGNRGDLCLTNLGVNVVESPIVIVGSSRTSHHYDSRIISDSLGKEVYNVGTDGCFFTHNCCVINSMLERYAPELIIWEFAPSYISKDKEDDVTSMYLYYGKRNYITETLDDVLPRSETIKLKSNIYRYNSKFLRVLTRFIKNNDTPDKYYGYEPSAPKILKEPLKLSEIQNSQSSVDEIKIKRLKETIDNAKNKGVRVVLINSPIYAIGSNSHAREELNAVCSELGVYFVDCSQLYLDHPEYFNDASHLNTKGAERYTQYIVSWIMSNE